MQVGLKCVHFRQPIELILLSVSDNLKIAHSLWPQVLGSLFLAPKKTNKKKSYYSVPWQIHLYPDCDFSLNSKYNCIELIVKKKYSDHFKDYIYKILISKTPDMSLI